MTVSKELREIVALSLVKNMGPVSFRKLREHFGSVEKIFKAGLLDLEKVKGISRINFSEMKHPDLFKKADLEIEKAVKESTQIIPFLDEAYPPTLKEIYDPPLVLYVKGRLPDPALPAVAIVGSRLASLYGLRMAETLSRELVQAGVVVVSGLALGVDSAAHQGALSAKGLTVAVLGSGLGQIYPAQNKKIALKICEEGALVSEYPVGMVPRPEYFPVRNRIISGLSSAVVVVEAAQKSGALITVDSALEQGRDVFAVPGNADSSKSQGTNHLLKQGAKLVTCAQDILEELKVRQPKTKSKKETSISLSTEETAVLALLENENLDVETLIEQSGLEPRQVISTLSLMEIKGLVKTLPGKNYVIFKFIKTHDLMMIELNGQKKELESGLTLSGLLAGLAIPKEKVVIELNLEIVSKNLWDSTALKEGDRVEIVHFVGGGSGTKAKALVIVESPAKCKTINKYLGPDFELVASMGHVIDLPKSKMGIDIEHDFEPQYIVTRDRKKTLSELKKKAKNKKEIYLACDPDREGEAISWHLKNQLGEGKKVCRVVFNEITKEAVKEAFKHPMEIDMNRVGAQQARRVLDRLVGYSLSPLLWQKVGRGLSAGRVQSVALRLIVDRERQIKAFIPEEYWTIEAILHKKTGDKTPFTAKLEKINEKKAEIKDKKTALEIFENVKTHPFIVQEVKQQKKKRNPYPPFTTSKLQQAAYNVLHFPASKTMRVAQMLYEGVELGAEGSVGLITYMRTDSVRLSDGALKETRDLILKDYGKAFLPPAPNVYKAKKGAQEAHEAIRPASVTRKPKDLESFLSPDQFKLYSLIWRQTVASQMTPAIIAQESAEILAGPHHFKATGSRIEFEGCLVVQGKQEDDGSPLPPLESREVLDLAELQNDQHFTKPPARFTDASLVKALEENGIGRPSTYAPTISTLTERDYVRREGGSLIPSELGMLVTDLLVKHFEKILDFEFTANMEEELDEVEEGKAEWKQVVKDFYGVFAGQMESAKSQMQTIKREAEPTDEICEKCGKPMVIKWGRRGRFMSCSGWPECKNAKSISTDVVCPQCGQGKLVQRRARSGRGRAFYGCTKYPECTFIANKLPKPGEPVLPVEDSSRDKETMDEIT